MDSLLGDGEETNGPSADPFDEAVVPTHFVGLVKEAHNLELFVFRPLVPTKQQSIMPLAQTVRANAPVRRNDNDSERETKLTRSHTSAR